MGNECKNKNREKKCFFCNELSDDTQNHHLVPKFLTEFFPNLTGRGGTIDLCPHCHEKVHYLLEPIQIALKYEVKLPQKETNTK